jgi:hypothetical protein
VCATDESGDVDKLNRRRNGAIGLRDTGHGFDPRIRDSSDPMVRFNRGKWVPGYGCAGTRERVEQTGFAGIGKTDDTDGKTHLVKGGIRG